MLKGPKRGIDRSPFTLLSISPYSDLTHEKSFITKCKQLCLVEIEHMTGKEAIELVRLGKNAVDE